MDIGGLVIRSALLNLRKYIIMNNLYNLEARGVEPLFPPFYVQQRPRMLYQSYFRGEYVFVHQRGRTWMLLVLLLGGKLWRHPESQYWTACFRDQNGRQRRISTKETNNKKALKIAEEFEQAAMTKRTVKQVQLALDRLHEEVSGERLIRATFHRYLNDWLAAKRAETALSTMTFYQGSLNKFLQFLGRRADEPMGEITKQDVVAFRDALIRQVSANDREPRSEGAQNVV